MSHNREIITVFQDYKTSISQYKEHWDNILSFKEIIGSQNCTLEANGDLSISHFIGAFSKGNTILQVLPKIYSDNSIVDSNDEIQRSLDFVYRLLRWSNFFKFKRLKSFREIEETDDLLEIIVRIFIDEFFNLHRKHIYREYVPKEEDHLFIKGQILFHKSLSYNSTKNFTKRIRYDDLSINNKINQIIKSTLLLLLGRVNSSENKRQLRLAVSYLEEVDSIQLDNSVFSGIVYNRINQDYQSLIELAYMLCNSQQPGLGSGNTQVLSFTVQLNILYEYFMGRVLNDVLETPYKVEYQKEGFLAKNSVGDNAFRLKPDFQISKNDKVVMIVDTKFKNPIKEKGIIHISSSDIYQMCAYAIRFECSEIILLYPLFIGQENRAKQTYTIKQDSITFKIRVTQVDIVQESYEKIVDEVRALFLTK